MNNSDIFFELVLCKDAVKFQTVVNRLKNKECCTVSDPFLKLLAGGIEKYSRFSQIYFLAKQAENISDSYFYITFFGNRWLF